MSNVKTQDVTFTKTANNPNRWLVRGFNKRAQIIETNYGTGAESAGLSGELQMAMYGKILSHRLLSRAKKIVLSIEASVNRVGQVQPGGKLQTVERPSLVVQASTPSALRHRNAEQQSILIFDIDQSTERAKVTEVAAAEVVQVPFDPNDTKLW